MNSVLLKQLLCSVSLARSTRDTLLTHSSHHSRQLQLLSDPKVIALTDCNIVQSHLRECKQLQSQWSGETGRSESILGKSVDQLPISNFIQHTIIAVYRLTPQSTLIAAVIFTMTTTNVHTPALAAAPQQQVPPATDQAASPPSRRELASWWRRFRRREEEGQGGSSVFCRIHILRTSDIAGTRLSAYKSARGSVLQEVLQRLSCPENKIARELGVRHLGSIHCDLVAFVCSKACACYFRFSSVQIFSQLTLLKSSSRSPGWYIRCAARR